MTEVFDINERKMPARLLKRIENPSEYGGRLISFEEAGVFFGNLAKSDDEVKNTIDGGAVRYAKASFYCLKSEGLDLGDRLLVGGKTYEIESISVHEPYKVSLSLSRRVS